MVDIRSTKNDMLEIIHQFETIDNTYKEYQLIIDAHS